MDKDELPLGFAFALVQDPAAMQRFSQLAPARRAELLQKAQTAASKAEMQSLVKRLNAR